MLDGRPIKRKARVFDGQELTVDHIRLTVHLNGDHTAPGVNKRQAMHRTPLAMAMTAFYGPHIGQTSLLPMSSKMRVGRAVDCELSLPRSQDMDEQQFECLVDSDSLTTLQQRPTVHLYQLSNVVKTLLNGKPIEQETATLGNVLQFRRSSRRGSTALLLHYSLLSEIWTVE